MPDLIRRLNAHGLAAFESYLRNASAGTMTQPPFHLLDSGDHSESLEQDIEVSHREFECRYDLGVYLCARIPEAAKQRLLGDAGLWSWLALYWFDKLCPAKAAGMRKASKPYNYILSGDFKHRPRHAIFTTWMLVDKYGELSRFMLSRPLDTRGEIVEQLAARQYYVSCEGIINAASQLYYDENRKTFKRGATSQKRKGNIRRFIGYLDQIDLTFDLGSLEGTDLVAMLPTEYEAFRA